MKPKHLYIAIMAYVAFQIAYWFGGSSDMAWVVAYYGSEKLMTAVALLACYSLAHSRFIKISAAYGAALCLFMFAYFIWCYICGHDSVMAMGALLLYSVLFLGAVKLMRL